MSNSLPPTSPSEKGIRALGCVLIVAIIFGFIVTCYPFLAGLAIGIGESGGNEDTADIDLGYHRKAVPQWVPDGTAFMFDYGDGMIYLFDLAHSRLETIATGSSRDYEDHSPDISPDGIHMVYVTRSYKTGFLWNTVQFPELAVSNIDGSNKQRLTTNRISDSHPEWSPDGKLIAFMTGVRIGAGYQRRLHIMENDGSLVRQLAPTIRPKSYHSPVWSPDGRAIALVGWANDEDREVVGNGSYSAVLYTVRVDGSGLTKLGNTLSPPAWSPDGRRVAFIRRARGSDISELYTVNVDGSNPQRVTSLQRPESDWYINLGNVSWSPDGSSILFRSWLIDVDGSNLRRLSSRFNSWSPDGSHIAGYEGIPNGLGAVLYIYDGDGSNAREILDCTYACFPK